MAYVGGSPVQSASITFLRAGAKQSSDLCDSVQRERKRETDSLDRLPAFAEQERLLRHPAWCLRPGRGDAFKREPLQAEQSGETLARFALSGLDVARSSAGGEQHGVGRLSHAIPLGSRDANMASFCFSLNSSRYLSRC